MHETRKRYHFYAAHRNQFIEGKCTNLHGHEYKVEVTISNEPEGEAGLGFSFESIDKHIEPIIAEYDHALLIDVGDKLFKVLKKEFPDFKMVMFNGATSVEALAEKLFNECSLNAPFEIKSIEVQETQSSTCRYEPK